MSSILPESPVIGITMGDAAGIGPEIVLKALSNPVFLETSTFNIVGDDAHLQKLAVKLGLERVLLSDRVKITDLGNLPSEICLGIDTAETGKASAEYIVTAVDLWRDGKIGSIATAPISKRAIAMGGYDFPGHTEFLAHLTETARFAMSFFADKLRVVLLSTHLPLTEAINRVRKDDLVDLIGFADQELSKILGQRVKIAVAGLNPHASEGGLFGCEEQDEIIPAIEHCRDDLGLSVSGPYSPDTVFVRCAQGEFDAVIALYHDQATIAVKSIAFNSGVNVTLGLPFIRTSVDHGTAYDIAGKNIAEAASMRAAIRLAGELSSHS